MRILIILFLSAHLYCEEAPTRNLSGIHSAETKSVLTDIGSEPSAIIAGCVNVISGNFTDYEVDLTVPGPEPFTFSRSYCSNDTSDSVFFRHWHNNHQGYILLRAQTYKHETELLIEELGQLGARTYFHSKTPQKTRHFDNAPYSAMYKNGLTNISQGIISAQNLLINTRCKFTCADTASCTISDGAGEIHEYKGLKEAKKPNFSFSNNDLFVREYMLNTVKKPSGMSFELTHLYPNHLDSITLKNRCGLPIGHLKVSRTGEKLHGIHYYTNSVKAPDGRFVTYKLNTYGKKNANVLKEVERSDGPKISYEHEDCDYTFNEAGELKGHVERINKKNKPDGRFLAIEYYDTGKNEIVGRTIKIDSRASPTYNRVKRLLAPCGTDHTPHTLYSFDYCISPSVNGTGVYDALGNKTDYFYNQQNRLEHILKFQGSSAPYTSEQIYWWDQNTSKEMCIKTRCFGVFGSSSKTYARSYFYDARGNLTTDMLCGNIRGISNSPLIVDAGGNITQVGPDQKFKACTYSNDNMNLLTYVKEGELCRVYSYVPGTNLLASCQYWNPQGIYSRSFYEYDENAMVIKSISDDGILFESHDLTGVNLRKIEYTTRSNTYPVGLPLEVKKFYWDPAANMEKLARREVNRFDPQGRMIEKKVYDANDEFAYSQEWAYNAFGNLLIEKNPLGHTISREYDGNGNIIKEEGPLPNTFKTFTYDYSNRLIRLDEHHPDGTFSQHYKYDLMGNQIASIDAFGNQTDYVYDAFGRKLSEQAPEVLIDGIWQRPTTHYTYDELSNPISITDAKGSTVKSAYTIYGKPYRIEYPDGSLEQFEYDLESRPVKEVARNGSITQNTYDYQGRITHKEITDPAGLVMASQEWGYNAVHLLYEKDPAGNLTEYGYDAQGRKTSIIKDSSRTTLEYDSLGRVIRTTYEGTVKAVEYNALDSIIEEREEDLFGNVLKQTRYTYDELGRKIETITGTGATVSCIYDTHGVPVDTIDAEGNSTKTHADYNFINSEGKRVYRLISIDPQGIKTTTIHDNRGKPVSLTTHSPYGTILHEQHCSYDLCGNRTKVIEIPHAEGTAFEPRIFCFEYDALHRLTAFIQAAGSSEEKRTQNTYNHFGEKTTTVKPDGLALHYTYDALGRLKDYFSSDGSFHYQYSYDLNSNPTHVIDLIQGKTTERSYDAFNNIATEKLQNGLLTAFTYSPDGKIQSLTLPDKTGVRYTYQGSFLKTIERLAKDGSCPYSHYYESYDKEGRIQAESLIYGIGTVNYSYSPKGHLLKSESPFFKEMGKSYDYKGNLLNRSIIDKQGTLDETYAYDALGQLKKENGVQIHSYTHDSLHNRISQDNSLHTHNLLNQLLQDKDYTYNYDLSGNLVEKNSRAGTTRYSYDALDRLIKVVTPDTAFNYTYDEMNRCMTISEAENDPLRLLYVMQAEMGGFNSKDEAAELQILGPGRRTEPCAAAVIELNQKPYAVLRDQSGHVRSLVDQTGQIAMTYRYSAFGIMESHPGTESLKNPWTVAGKRYEPLTGLVLFGRRFYEPETGRWITLDPAGFDAGPNLYAYLGCSPLVHYDAYGLFENNFSLYNCAEKVYNVASTILSGAFYVGRTYANAIYKLSWHFIPIPGVKDIPMAAGYFLSRGTMKGYTMSYNMPHSKVLEAGEGHRPGVGHCSGNGICTTEKEGQNFAERVSQVHGGEKVYHAYGAHHGLVSDLGECGLQKLGIRTHQVRITENAIHLAAKDANEAGIQGYVSADFHSRGGIALSNARNHISADTEKMLFISTYGTGTIAKRGGSARVMNYMGTSDVVSFLGTPFWYSKARLFGDSTITFLPSNGKWFDHGFMDETYQGALEASATAFNDFLLERK